MVDHLLSLGIHVNYIKGIRWEWADDLNEYPFKPSAKNVEHFFGQDPHQGATHPRNIHNQDISKKFGFHFKDIQTST